MVATLYSNHDTSLMGSVRVGTAGWSYKDWEGIVYPEQLKRAQHPVEYMAQYFDVIEINTSFYGPLKPELATLWCHKAAAVNPEFLFTAKLYKNFTHSPLGTLESTSAKTIRPSPDDEIKTKQGLDAMAREGKLGALLIQFPISFKNTEENRDYLDLLLRQFIEYKPVVEVRHDTWSSEDTLEYFTRRGVAFCNIDQPLIGKAVRPSDHVTAPIAYVRLHGRNYEQWFEHEKPHDRYNYLYTEDELRRWKDRIERVRDRAETTFVIANNHFEGKAAVNALQLKSMLHGKPVPAPEPLVKRYPQLLGIAAKQAGKLF